MNEEKKASLLKDVCDDFFSMRALKPIAFAFKEFTQEEYE